MGFVTLRVIRLIYLSVCLCFVVQSMTEALENQVKSKVTVKVCNFLRMDGHVIVIGVCLFGGLIIVCHVQLKFNLSGTKVMTFPCHHLYVYFSRQSIPEPLYNCERNKF
jgi:hypothetical protein